jgi:putative aminopeptidase FrvX
LVTYDDRAKIDARRSSFLALASLAPLSAHDLNNRNVNKQDPTIQLLQKLADASPNRKLTAFTKEIAAAKSIPPQTDLVQGYGDDSAELQRTVGGLPTVNLVVPVRYTHAHNGIMNRRDFDQMVDLPVAIIEKLDAAKVAEIRDFTP